MALWTPKHPNMFILRTWEVFEASDGIARQYYVDIQAENLIMDISNLLSSQCWVVSVVWVNMIMRYRLP